MKKLLVILIAIMMGFIFSSCKSEEPSNEKHDISELVGSYNNYHDGTAEIEVLEGNRMKVVIRYRYNAQKIAEWSMTGILDRETEILEYSDAVRSDISYEWVLNQSTGGGYEEKERNEKYSNATGKIYFYREDGQSFFTWEHDKEYLVLWDHTFYRESDEKYNIDDIVGKYCDGSAAVELRSVEDNKVDVTVELGRYPYIQERWYFHGRYNKSTGMLEYEKITHLNNGSSNTVHREGYLVFDNPNAVRSFFWEDKLEAKVNGHTFNLCIPYIDEQFAGIWRTNIEDIEKDDDGWIKLGKYFEEYEKYYIQLNADGSFTAFCPELGAGARIREESGKWKTIKYNIGSELIYEIKLHVYNQEVTLKYDPSTERIYQGYRYYYLSDS